jgi:hypothetical protein
MNLFPQTTINATWLKSHPDIQGPLCQHPQWLCPYFPFAPMAPTSPTGRMATSSPPTIATKSQLIHLCAHLWPPRLQETSICSNQDRGPCTQQTTQMSNLHRTLQKGICLWQSHRTLPVLEILVNGNPSYSNLRRCVFKHKYLTNLLVTPEDLVIATAKNLAQALETSIPQHL